MDGTQKQEYLTVILSLGYAAGGVIHLANPGPAGQTVITFPKITSWPGFLRLCCSKLQIWKMEVAIFNSEGEELDSVRDIREGDTLQVVCLPPDEEEDDEQSAEEEEEDEAATAIAALNKIASRRGGSPGLSPFGGSPERSRAGSARPPRVSSKKLQAERSAEEVALEERAGSPPRKLSARNPLFNDSKVDWAGLRAMKTAAWAVASDRIALPDHIPGLSLVEKKVKKKKKRKERAQNQAVIDLANKNSTSLWQTMMHVIGAVSFIEEGEPAQLSRQSSKLDLLDRGPAAPPPHARVAAEGEKPSVPRHLAPVKTWAAATKHLTAMWRFSDKLATKDHFLSEAQKTELAEARAAEGHQALLAGVTVGNLDARTGAAPFPPHHVAEVWCGGGRTLLDVKLQAAKLLGVQLHNPKSQKPIRRWQDRPFAATVQKVRDALNLECDRKGQTLLQAFLGMDHSSDANLDPSELIKGIRKLKVKMTSEQEEQLLKFADRDGDGEINFNEFWLAMHVEVSTEADEEEDDLQSSAELQCQGVQLTRVNELHDAMLPARFNDFSRPLFPIRSAQQWAELMEEQPWAGAVLRDRVQTLIMCHLQTAELASCRLFGARCLWELAAGGTPPEGTTETEMYGSLMSVGPVTIKIDQVQNPKRVRLNQAHAAGPVYEMDVDEAHQWMDEVQCAVSAMYSKVHQPNGAAMLMSVAAIPMLVTWLQVFLNHHRTEPDEDRSPQAGNAACIAAEDSDPLLEAAGNLSVVSGQGNLVGCALPPAEGWAWRALSSVRRSPRARVVRLQCVDVLLRVLHHGGALGRTVMDQPVGTGRFVNKGTSLWSTVRSTHKPAGENKFARGSGWAVLGETLERESSGVDAPETTGLDTTSKPSFKGAGLPKASMAEAYGITFPIPYHMLSTNSNVAVNTDSAHDDEQEDPTSLEAVEWMLVKQVARQFNLLFEQEYAINPEAAVKSDGSKKPVAHEVMNRLGGLNMILNLLQSKHLLWKRCGAVLLGYCYGMNAQGHHMLVRSHRLSPIIQNVCKLLEEGIGWEAAPRAAATMVALFNALIERATPDAQAIQAMLVIPSAWKTTTNAAMRGVGVTISVLARNPEFARVIMSNPTNDYFREAVRILALNEMPAVRKAAIDTLLQLCMHQSAREEGSGALYGDYRGQLARDGFWKLLTPCCQTLRTTDVSNEVIQHADAVPGDDATSLMTSPIKAQSKKGMKVAGLLETLKVAGTQAEERAAHKQLDPVQIANTFEDIRAGVFRGDRRLRELFDSVPRIGEDLEFVNLGGFRQLIQRIMPDVDDEFRLEYLMALTDTDADGQVSFEDFEVAIKYNVLELALERCVYHRRAPIPFTIHDALRRLSVVLDKLQVTCRRLLDDFDVDRDQNLSDSELQNLVVFLLPNLHKDFAKTLVRMELEHLLTPASKLAADGMPHDKMAKSFKGPKLCSLLQFQQLLTLDDAQLHPALEKARATPLAQDAVAAIMMMCANDSKTLNIDSSLISTLVYMCREPAGSLTQLYSVAALWCLMRNFQSRGVHVQELTKAAVRSIASALFRCWSMLQCARLRPPSMRHSQHEIDAAQSTLTYGLGLLWLIVCDDHGRAAAMGDHAPGTIGSSALRRSALCEGVDLLMDVALVTCVSATGNANGYFFRNMAMKALYTLCVLNPHYREAVTALGLRMPLQAFMRTPQPSDQTRAMASVLYYLMTEDGGTEAGWEIGDDGATNEWDGIPLRRRRKEYFLDKVLSTEAYFYHQEHFRGLAITQASNTDVYLAEGGLHASRDSEAAPTPRFVGYFVENKASGSQLELTRQFLTEEACECLMFQMLQPETDIQCAGANGASILAHNHKVQLGRLGVIDASASLMRQPGTATKTSAHLLHTLLSLSVSKENQVPIAQKCVRVLVHLNEICTKFLHEFVGDESMEQDEEVKRQLTSSMEVLRFSGGVLHNLLQHPANRTLVFRTELQTRARHSHEHSQHTRPPGLQRLRSLAHNPQTPLDLGALAVPTSGTSHLTEATFACPERDFFHRLVDEFAPESPENEDDDNFFGTLGYHDGDEELRRVLAQQFAIRYSAMLRIPGSSSPSQVTGSLSRSLTSPHMTVSLHDEARPGAWRGGTPALGRTCSLIDAELDAGDEDGSSAGEALGRGGFLTQSVTMRVPRGRALEWGASVLGESGLGSKNVELAPKSPLLKARSMKKNLLVNSPRGRAPTAKRATWDRLDDNEDGLMDPVDAGDSAGSPQPTPSSESETTCARAEDEASHNVRNQHSFSPLRSVSFRPHTAELPTIRPITSEMAGDRPTTTLAFAPRRFEDQDQRPGGQGRTATLPAIAAKSSLMPRVEGSELLEDDQLGVHIGHVARFYGPFHHDVQSKGDRHMAHAMRKPMRNLWAPVATEQHHKLTQSKPGMWQESIVALIPRLPPEKVEGIHLAEDTGEDSGEDGPNQRRSRAHGVLRAGWTVQRGLKGGAFFLNLHTGGTARCQCQEISYKVVCQVHSKPENWRFHDTNSEWHLSDDLKHHQSQWFKRKTIARIPRPKQTEKTWTRKLGARDPASDPSAAKLAAATAGKGKQGSKLSLTRARVGLAPGDAVDVFYHAPGCQICKGMFEHYQLPDGRSIHMIVKPRSIVDGVDVVLELPRRPFSLLELEETRLPAIPEAATGMQEVVRLWHAAVPESVPGAVKIMPPHHVLPATIKHACEDPTKCHLHGVLQDQRLRLKLDYSIPPAPPPPPVYAPRSRQLDMRSSAWREREFDCESRGWTDHKSVFDRMVAVDWKQILEGSSIRRLLLGDSPAVGYVFRRHSTHIYAIFAYYSALGPPSSDLSLELNEWSQFVNDHHVADAKRTDLCRKHMCETIFINTHTEWGVAPKVEAPKDAAKPPALLAIPSSSSIDPPATKADKPGTPSSARKGARSPGVGRAKQSSPRGLSRERGGTSPKSPRSPVRSRVDALRLNSGVSGEDPEQKPAAKHTVKKALTPRLAEAERVVVRRSVPRAAFLECLIRVAILKYLKSHQRYSKPRSAFEGLILNHLLPHIKKETMEFVNANRWRNERMYILEVNNILKAPDAAEMIDTLFAKYASKNVPSRMPISGWFGFCRDSMLIKSEATFMTKKDCMVLFHLSRMAYSNPHSDEAHGMSKSDFVEAICRCADFIGPPTPAELQHFFRFSEANKHSPRQYYEYIVNMIHSKQRERRQIPRRTSSGLNGTTRLRPLYEKLPQIMCLIGEAQKELHGVDSITDLTEAVFSPAPLPLEVDSGVSMMGTADIVQLVRRGSAHLSGAATAEP